MGICASKKITNVAANIFEQQKQYEENIAEEIKNNVNPMNRRVGAVNTQDLATETHAPELRGTRQTHASEFHTSRQHSSKTSTSHIRSYDDEALDIMRFQLYNDTEVFLLNILLSVQFFENYEREVPRLKVEPVCERENLIYEAMLQRNKHVFFAERQLECVNKHVCFQKSKEQTETLSSPKLYVIYDNVRLIAHEDKDTCNSAPFYKLKLEETKQSGLYKLKQVKVIEKKLHEGITIETCDKESIYTDSGKESNSTDGSHDMYSSTEEESSPVLKTRVEQSYVLNKNVLKSKVTPTNMSLKIKLNSNSGKRQISFQEVKNDMTDQENKKPRSVHFSLVEEFKDNGHNKESTMKTGVNNTKTTKQNPRNTKALSDRKLVKTKSISHNNRSNYKKNTLEDDTDTSGYGSTSGDSSRRESLTSNKIKLQSNSDELPNESWTAVLKTTCNSRDDESEGTNDFVSKQILYLNSITFMHNFVDNFKHDLGRAMLFSKKSLKTATTQGVNIQCDSLKRDFKSGCKIFPALNAAWPNAANPWIIRERKIIENPKNKYKYQWPVEDMVKNATDFGCLLIPAGVPKPTVKTESNLDQNAQWRIVFPAAECYLESQLAHSHMRCYLFTLLLHKTFMDRETSQTGIDVSLFKQHLFWKCEENFAKWPEDRLGESLKSFLKSLYAHFVKSKLPNYFMDSCNELRNIPMSTRLKFQWQLKNFLETPVMHMLYAINKLKYNTIEFYPAFNCQRLYDILISENPMVLLTPRLPISENSQVNDINVNIKLPKKLEALRRHQVLKFFIPHFIAMARSSEKFGSINQAMIYLEQARRLCLLLQGELGGDNADEFMYIISEMLTDYRPKLATQEKLKLPFGNKNHNSNTQKRPSTSFVKSGVSYEQAGIPPVSFADVHEVSKLPSASINVNINACGTKQFIQKKIIEDTDDDIMETEL